VLRELPLILNARGGPSVRRRPRWPRV